MTEIQVHLPKPHSKQADFLHSPAKRKVIVAGRRGGKTTGVSIWAAESCLAGRRFLYAAPTQDQTEAFWTAEKLYFADVIKAGIAYKNETQRVIELGKGRIKAKTAWDADTLRGDYADDMALEEFSLMDPAAWYEVGAPMLLDNNGNAVFIFTPKRKNHAYKIHSKAIADDSGRWAAWHFTSFDNPHLSKDALNEIISDMTEDAYRQEIMAEFLEGEGQVFRNIVACMNAPDTTPEAHQGHHFGMGVDWGKQDDFTVLSVVCTDCKQEVALDRFNKIDYHFQRGRLKALADKWNVETILAESNSMGEAVIDELQFEGLPVMGFATTATSKPPLIESLALSFEREEMQWLDNAIATAELESYERKVTATTGRSQYSAPSGMHDDTVMARALANKLATGGLTGALMA